MAFTPSTIFSVTGGANTISGITATSPTASVAIDSISVSVPPNTTFQSYALTLVAANIQQVFINCDQSFYLFTNTTNSATQSFRFIPASPMSWINGQPMTCPITANVSVFFLTNPNGSQTLNVNGQIATT